MDHAARLAMTDTASFRQLSRAPAYGSAGRTQPLFAFSGVTPAILNSALPPHIITFAKAALTNLLIFLQIPLQHQECVYTQE